MHSYTTLESLFIAREKEPLSGALHPNRSKEAR
jgi:hypothetical protein